MSGKVDIEITQSASFGFAFDYLAADNSPIDLSGHVFAMQIRPEVGGPIQATLSTANGKITWNPGTGRFVCSLTPTDTAAMQLDGAGVYDLFSRALSNTDAERIIYGDVIFNRSVTR